MDGERLQFEKQMIKNQFEKKKSQIIFDEDMSLNEKLLTFLYYPLAWAMAPHSSTLAWKIPWMEEPGRLESMGSLRVGHN